MVDNQELIEDAAPQSSQAYFLLMDGDLQTHIFGCHGWHAELRDRLEELGVVLEEQFCSPCG